MDKYKIALIDDDEVFVSIIKGILKDYTIDTFTNSKDGLNALKDNAYDILILDYYIDKMNGADIVNEIRKTNKNLYIIILTGYSSDIPGTKALKELDIQDYCEKDAKNNESLIVRIEVAIKSIEQNRKLKNNSVKMNFPEKLKFLRESKGELQSDLANILGVSRQSIGGYESGRAEPSYNILKLISKHYKVSIDFLLDNKFIG